MAQLYDLVLILDPAAPDDVRAKVLTDVEKAISGPGGSIADTHDWGARALSFEIDKKTDGEYHLVQFEIPPAAIEPLERSLRINDAVLRHRVIKVKPGTPPPPSLRAAAPAAAAEVEA